MLINGKLSDVPLPYGLTAKQILRAMVRTADVLERINEVAPLVETFGKNALSSAVSNLMEKHLAECSPAIVRNGMTMGHPDILPAGRFKDDKVLHGKEGIEVKVTGSKTIGIVSHNIERSWVIVFHYRPEPFQFLGVFIAKLSESDWTFADFGERSTPKVRINKAGMTKLRAGKVYTAT